MGRGIPTALMGRPLRRSGHPMRHNNPTGAKEAAPAPAPAPEPAPEAEEAAFSMSNSKAELLAVKPTGKGDVTKSHVAWRMIKGVPNKPSPLLVGEHLYLVTDGGVASCVAAKTGKVVWQERVGGEYSSAPVCVENRIYAFSQSGKTVVFRASPEKFELLAENKLGFGFMASPAIAGKAFYLRSKTHLYRIESK